MAWPDLTRDRIATLRWRHGGGDALAARRAIERALAPLDWGPRGQGSEAIVCVRRLRGALRTGGASAAPSGEPWRERIAALAAAAPRPWREPVPSDAAAVVFEDEAELLACLARDAGRSAGDDWWWPALIGEPAGQAVLLRRWHASPALLPAVLRRLARRGEVAPVLRAIGEDAAQSLAAAVARAFAIDLGVVPAPERKAAPHRALVAWTSGQRAQLAALVAEVAAALGAQSWSRTPAAARLLAIAFATTEQPRLARAAGFVAALPATAQSHEAQAPAIRSRAASPAPVGVAPAPASDRESGAAPVAMRADATRVGRTSVPSTQVSDGELPNAARADAPVPSTMASLDAPPAATVDDDEPAPPVTASPHRVPAVIEPPLPNASPDLGLRVRSAFAGTLYLLPMAVHLGWYGDFTQPLAPGLALHPADLLTLFGERLAGAAWAGDELPALLAAWAGRTPGEPAGEGFRPEGGEALADWLTARERELAQRAAAALGMDADEVLRWLVWRDGEVSLTELALEARFDLATHPLAIRLAGLDRDLGWLPAGGRRIVFHFDLHPVRP